MYNIVYLNIKMYQKLPRTYTLSANANLISIIGKLIFLWESGWESKLLCLEGKEYKFIFPKYIGNGMCACVEKDIRNELLKSIKCLHKAWRALWA